MIATVQLQIVPGPTLPGDVLARFAAKAAAAGKSVDTFLAEVITREVSAKPAKKPSAKR